MPGAPIVDSDFTGVENDMAPAETVRIALRLLPGTKNVVVARGVSPVDREELADIKEELKAYECRVDISYLTDSAMPDLLERLRHLPSNTVVLLTSLGADVAGTSFKSNAQVVSSVYTCSVSNSIEGMDLPIYQPENGNDSSSSLTTSGGESRAPSPEIPPWQNLELQAGSFLTMQSTARYTGADFR